MTPNRRTLIKLLASAPASVFAGGTSQLVSLPIPIGDGPVPVFENGFVGIIDANRRTIHRLDMAGRLAGPLYVTVPGADSWMVMTAGISRAGVFAAGVGAKDSAGRLASLLVLANPGAADARIIQLGGFGVGKVAFLPGGEIVCLGREVDQNFSEVPGHEVLRFYSPDGVLLRKALPVETLRPVRKDKHPLNWLMRVNGRTIGLLDGEGFRYSEVDHSGEVMRPPGPLPAFAGPVVISGFALADNGDRIVSVQVGEPVGERLNFGRRTALYRFAGAPNTAATRTLIEPSFLPEWVRGTMVLGLDGDRLVLLPNPATHLLVCPPGIG